MDKNNKKNSKVISHYRFDFRSKEGETAEPLSQDCRQSAKDSNRVPPRIQIYSANRSKDEHMGMHVGLEKVILKIES
jgi:hypothetical protein